MVPSSVVDEASCSTVISIINPPDLSHCRDNHSEADDASDGDNPSGVKVVSTNNNPGHRVWDKRYYCIYCKASVSRLPRHLYSAHADEIAVAEIMAASQDKKQALLTKIRNLGNEAHNCEVLSTGAGQLAVVYRPSTEVEMTGSEYIPCEHCHGYFNRRQLWRHVKSCKCKSANVASSSRPAAAGDLLLPCKADGSTKKLISGMKKGLEFNIVQSDRLIQRFAGKLLSRVGHSKHHMNYIRSRLRKLAKLLIHIRRTNATLGQVNLETVLAPKYFRTVLESVKALAGYSGDDHSYIAPVVCNQHRPRLEEMCNGVAKHCN